MQTAASLPATACSLSFARLGRNHLLGAAAFDAIIAAAAWQWNWLVALGVAPLLLSAAPCAAMCGRGLCIRRVGNRSCGASPQGGPAVRETVETPSATQET